MRNLIGINREHQFSFMITQCNRFHPEQERKLDVEFLEFHFIAAGFARTKIQILQVLKTSLSQIYGS